MAKPKYQFYEVVRINATKPDSIQRGISKVNGLEGAILGMSQDSQGIWGYAVSIYSLETVWDILEHELEPTGKMDSRDTFYDGSSISVEVNPDTGEGRLKDSE